MKRLTTKQKQRINEIWEELDDGDMSTEMLFERVAQQASTELRMTIDHGDVSESIQ